MQFVRRWRRWRKRGRWILLHDCLRVRGLRVSDGCWSGRRHIPQLRNRRRGGWQGGRFDIGVRPYGHRLAERRRREQRLAEQFDGFVQQFKLRALGARGGRLRRFGSGRGGRRSVATKENDSDGMIAVPGLARIGTRPLGAPEGHPPCWIGPPPQLRRRFPSHGDSRAQLAMRVAVFPCRGEIVVSREVSGRRQARRGGPPGT
jgi:hypothetical protein